MYKQRFFNYRLLWAIEALLLIALLGVPAKVSADGDDESLIHACVKKGGKPTIVSPSTTCPPKQTPLHWKKAGVTVLTSGSFPNAMGCIPCDGQGRFMGPGINGLTTGLGVGNPGEAIMAVPMPAGTLKNLRVNITFSDGGIWGFGLWVNHAPASLGCNINPGQVSCEDLTDEVVINDGDTVSLAVGNPGDPFTFGGFHVKWSMELEPAL